MTQISVELVPRSVEALTLELSALKHHFPQVNTINIPDLLRFDVRSWDACAVAKNYFGRAIPHVRAMDFDLRQPLALSVTLPQLGLDTVLVVSGDMPQDMAHRVYKTGAVELIRQIKRDLPGIKIYASIDSYRSGFRTEIDYVKQKLDAGADGFFTQPFFDLRLLEIYADLLPCNDVFWGVSPVLTDRSRNYWETKNNAIFPKSFAPTLDWNAEFARKLLETVGQRGGHIYFMPIRADIVDYLSRVFET